MRDEPDAFDDLSLLSRLRLHLRRHFGALASIGFALVAVGAIQFHEHMSPALVRVSALAAAGAAKTVRAAHSAMTSAALPFVIRG